MEYPRFVFISPGSNKCNGGTYDHEVVKDASEHKAALDAGFSDSIPEALEAATVTKKTIEDDRFQSQHHEISDSMVGIESAIIPGLTGLPKRGRPAKAKE